METTVALMYKFRNGHGFTGSQKSFIATYSIKCPCCPYVLASVLHSDLWYESLNTIISDAPAWWNEDYEESCKIDLVKINVV